MLLTILMFVVALCLSSVAAFYSIVGLTAIFSAAVIPIVIMGSILEVAKLVVTVWLHEYWRQCRLVMKFYLVPAVGVLMLLTSMGIFGFLSRAHLDQAVPTGDVVAQVALIDEKIRTERENVETARRALAQMDAQVDQRLSRSNDDNGAERAVQIRRAQARERQQIQNDIAAAQKRIAALNEERAPIASQLRKVEAEVGPIKYIAALIYGDNPDTNLLERAVRWVIIVLVAVFDPLAVVMLLAFTESLAWERQRRGAKVAMSPPVSTQTETQQPQVTTDPVVFPPTPEIPRPEPDTAILLTPSEPDIATPSEPDTATPPTPAEPDIATPAEPVAAQAIPTDDPDVDEDPESNPRVKEAMKLWKSQNPSRTLKEEKQKFRQGIIQELPWMSLLEQLPREPNLEFAPRFPIHSQKGDICIRTDVVPNQLYKFNGEQWIAVDKNSNDSYTYHEAYIDHLIQEIQAGRYDAEMLTVSELDQIEQRLRDQS